MAIRCCNGCVAPKRYPGGHSVCPDYIKEKAEHDAWAEAGYKRRSIRSGLINQQYNAVSRANKGKRKTKED